VNRPDRDRVKATRITYERVSTSGSRRRKRVQVVAGLMALVLVLALVGGLLASSSSDDAPSASTLANGLTVSDDTTPLGPPVTTRYSDLPTISPTDLPPEAVTTAALIQSGGPFPYPQDGSVFQNREGLLPDEPAGYYKEYTVRTPGSDDRGARRLIVGEGGGIYYTDDHYESFSEIVG
jgi:ribonuclease T1